MRAPPHVVASLRLLQYFVEEKREANKVQGKENVNFKNGLFELNCKYFKSEKFSITWNGDIKKAEISRWVEGPESKAFFDRCIDSVIENRYSS